MPYNRMVQRQAISIAGSFDDSVGALNRLLGGLAPIRDATEAQAFQIDLSKLRHLGSDAATMLSGCVLDAKSRGELVDMKWAARRRSGDCRRGETFLCGDGDCVPRYGRLLHGTSLLR